MTRFRVAALFFVLGALGLLGSYQLIDLDGRNLRLPLGTTALSVGWLWIGFGLRRASRSARFFAMGFCAALFIGAVIIPAYVALLFVISQNPSPFETEESISEIKKIAAFIALCFLVAGVFGFHALRYLRTVDCRLEFSGKDPDVAHAVVAHESIGAVIGAALVALVASLAALPLTVKLPTESLPDSVKSDDMLRRESIDVKNLNAAVTSAAFFTTDSRHLMIPPSEKQDKFLVLDLDSGRLRRVATGHHEFDPVIDVAPDGSAIVAGSRWISLTDGSTRRLAALPEADHLGFASPHEYLAYDSVAQQVALIDLRNDSIRYALPLARGERDSGHGKWRLWVDLRDVPADHRAWSADRQKHLWLTQDHTLHVLDVASGRVVDRLCKACRFGSSPLLTSAGDALFFDRNSGWGEAGRSFGKADLFRVGFDESREIAFRGKPFFVANGGAYVLFQQVGRDRLTFRDLHSHKPREWILPLPETSRHAEMRGGRVLELRVAGRREPVAHYAAFVPPTAGAEMKFVQLKPAEELAEFKQIAPDGRYLLLVAGATIEIVDIDALLRGESASRTMDVLDDDELRPVELPSRGASDYTARWVEREVELPPLEPWEERRAMEAAQTVPPSRREETPRKGGILKCVSTSGDVTFTQGVCPAGTRQQDAPRADSF